jgi:hypothetical protein
MIFNDKHLIEQVDNLRLEVIHLKSQIQNQQTMIDAHLKVWSSLQSTVNKLSGARYGLKDDGTPRLKPGRKVRVAA